MMTELKKCPFCGSEKVFIQDCEFTDQVDCPNCGYITTPERWNKRPIEDALQSALTLAQEENKKLIEDLSESFQIKFEHEDELPKLKKAVYDAMFNCSHVDITRLFPYIEENGEKYYLVLLGSQSALNGEKND